MIAVSGAGDPVALPGLAVIAVALVVFVAALLMARRRRGVEATGNRTRSRRSMIGIAAQGIAFGVATAGPPAVTLDPLSAKALAEAVAIAFLTAGAIALFFWASRTMGRNWSIVARTRDDHALVTTGPFALVRHPIYVALFGFMIALAIAFGHTGRLPVAVPLYAVGTWIRIGVEERLLAAMFGAAYREYAARVKRFFPGVF